VDPGFRFLLQAERMRKRPDGSFELTLVLTPQPRPDDQQTKNVRDESAKPKPGEASNAA
jgi:hypothetical protein